MSPGGVPSLSIEPSGGLDFISSRGYPEIEFGYDSGSEEEGSDDEIDDSTSADIRGHNGVMSPGKNNLVSGQRLIACRELVRGHGTTFASPVSMILPPESF